MGGGREGGVGWGEGVREGGWEGCGEGEALLLCVSDSLNTAYTCTLTPDHLLGVCQEWTDDRVRRQWGCGLFLVYS